MAALWAAEPPACAIGTALWRDADPAVLHLGEHVPGRDGVVRAPLQAHRFASAAAREAFLDRLGTTNQAWLVQQIIDVDYALGTVPMGRVLDDLATVSLAAPRAGPPATRRRRRRRGLGSRR